MFHVTLPARNQLHDILMEVLTGESQSRLEPGVDGGQLSLRLAPHDRAVDSAQLGLVVDSVRPDDQVVQHEGRLVLVVDPSTSALLEDLTLDVVTTPDGTSFGLRR